MSKTLTVDEAVVAAPATPVAVIEIEGLSVAYGAVWTCSYDTSGFWEEIVPHAYL